MRFQLVDRIIAVEPGKSLRAVKHLTLAEEYLHDHFPTFPVMPGVMQLQALVEAGAWLMRLSEDFARSIWALREAKNVKYGTFMPPGHKLDLSVELLKQDGAQVTLRGKGEVNGTQTVVAQYVLAGYRLSDCHPHGQEREARLVRQLRDRSAILLGEVVPPRAASGDARS